MSDEDVEWSRFLPTGPLPDTWSGDREAALEFWRAEEDGAVFLAWHRHGWSVRRKHMSQGRLLSGFEDWQSESMTTLIRHADGRWAEGYNPSGKCHELCSAALAWCPEGFFSDHHPDLEVGYCTAACRDRAAAKASAPTVERLADGWARLGHDKYRCRCGDLATFGNGQRASCIDCAPAMGVFASPVTVARHPEPVVCAHVGCDLTSPHMHGEPIVWRNAPLPQWLIEERALMQSVPPTQVLPEFPRSKIERDNLHLRPQFQRSPRYGGGRR